MAFQLRLTESVAHGLPRLAKKELRAARTLLRRTTPPPDEAIHEARKSIKKVRAIVELVEAGDGRLSSGVGKRLRRVSRTLSRLRDADAMSEILTKLRKKNPLLISEHSFARMRRQLASHKKAAKDAAARDGAWEKVDRELRKARRAAKGLSVAHRGFRALAPGIDLTHRRGRKAMTRARTRQRAEDFHEWRKQIKALWYELRLLEVCGKSVRRDVRALHSAETWLGDDHNIVVLCAELSKDPSVCGGMADLDRLRVAADRYQCELRRKATATAAGIYRRQSTKYVRALSRAWKAARRRHAKAGRPALRKVA
jgi:CHAD domain-containing protein